MKPTERLMLIQGISDRLEELEWANVDLTLRQFGLPWSSSWEGDKHTYCIAHVENGEDGALLDLYEHFYGKPFDPGLRAAVPDRWRKGYLRLFLSHISAHKILVADVKAKLASFGVDAFVAHEDIVPTAEWVTEIEAALDTCDALAAFLTPDFHVSSWTDQEVGFCLKRRVLIVPIRLGVDPYGFMGRFQALTAGGRDASWIGEAIFDILLKHELTAAKMSEGVVTLFEKSDSFAEAKYNMGLVKRLRSVTPQLLRRLEDAVSLNDQVEGAWGVPEQVRAFVAAQAK